MNFELVKIEELSGENASIYSVFVEAYEQTLLDRFIEENQEEHLAEIINIIDKLKVIGDETGAREGYFKLKEGEPGDLVAALYDRPKAKLRLYCIRIGMDLVIIGGGALKPATVKAWQEDAKLSEEANWMKFVSKEFYKKLLDKDIYYINDGKDLAGDLKFIYEEE